MIKVKIPAFKYKEEIVLKDIDIEFEIGQTYGIIGLNGAGKTTFFNLLSGFMKDQGCSITNNGQPIPKKEISHIDTDPYFFRNLTAREFLSVFKSANVQYNEQKLSELLKLDLDKLIEEYSTGMKKKLLLLSQVKQDKKIYILDEPFNGLDLETNKILDIMIKLLNKRGKTVFVSSHILEPLFSVCHSISFLKNKCIFKTYQQEKYNEIEDELFGDFSRNVEKELSGIL